MPVEPALGIAQRAGRRAESRDDQQRPEQGVGEKAGERPPQPDQQRAVAVDHGGGDGISQAGSQWAASTLPGSPSSAASG